MRPIVIQGRRLQVVQQDLESAAEDITSAVERVDAPTADYPWHRLVEEGVRVLLEDTRVVARSCRNVAEAIKDSLDDFGTTDGHIGIAAQVDQVQPYSASPPAGLGHPLTGPR